MIFSSLEYVVFFCLVVAALMAIPQRRLQKAILLGASYFFYAYWDWRFLSLMVGMTVANYAIGGRIHQATDAAVRKRWLIASVVLNLSLLGVFKYFNFFIGSANALLAQFGLRFSMVEILLPIGISFITFEVMSYVIDLYRRTSPPAKHLGDLALLVAFFPHLIAGPILKPSHFLPQLQQPIRITAANAALGFQIFLLGLAKKLVIADNMAAFADPVFADPARYDGATVWLAVLAYALQIYGDFSGYSDMAIGSARILGFEIPRNFERPYFSTSITVFWRRWHISLSTWLREYLYISLGGNRHGKARQDLNLMLTMLLGGLWHGASWNFVIWGGLHGLGLMVHKRYMALSQAVPALASPWLAPLYGLLTFGFVCFAWIFFRATDFATAGLIIQKLGFVGEPGGLHWAGSVFLWAVPAMLAYHVIAERLSGRAPLKLGSFRGSLLVSLLVLAVVYLAPVRSSPFIYFQF